MLTDHCCTLSSAIPAKPDQHPAACCFSRETPVTWMTNFVMNNWNVHIQILCSVCLHIQTTRLSAQNTNPVRGAAADIDQGRLIMWRCEEDPSAGSFTRTLSASLKKSTTDPENSEGNKSGVFLPPNESSLTVTALHEETALQRAMKAAREISNTQLPAPEGARRAAGRKYAASSRTPLTPPSAV